VRSRCRGPGGRRPSPCCASARRSSRPAASQGASARGGPREGAGGGAGDGGPTPCAGVGVRERLERCPCCRRCCPCPCPCACACAKGWGPSCARLSVWGCDWKGGLGPAAAPVSLSGLSSGALSPSSTAEYCAPMAHLCLLLLRSQKLPRLPVPPAEVPRKDAPRPCTAPARKEAGGVVVAVVRLALIGGAPGVGPEGVSWEVLCRVASSVGGGGGAPRWSARRGRGRARRGRGGGGRWRRSRPRRGVRGNGRRGRGRGGEVRGHRGGLGGAAHREEHRLGPGACRLEHDGS